MTNKIIEGLEEALKYDIVEIAALAAWKSYCGVPDHREEWWTDEDWEESQAALATWRESPDLCTHIGADGFRSIARDVLKEIGFADAFEAGRRAEREAVVAWLREDANWQPNPLIRDGLEYCYAAIERLSHLPPTTKE